MAEGGDGFDPCECIFSHQGAMRRLMNMLRDSQTVCNDQECMVNNPGLVTPSGGNNVSTMMLFFGWIVLLLVLFLMRPNSMRGSRQANKRTRPDNFEDQNQEPPSPGVH